MDLDLGLKGTHVIITGAAGHIGRAAVEAFIAAGAKVSAFDIKAPGQISDEKKGSSQHDPSVWWKKVDITDEDQMNEAFRMAFARDGVAAVCVALAGLDLSYLPHHASLCDMPLAQWQRTHRVNVEGTFITARAWLRGIRDHAGASTRNASLILTGSEAGIFGVDTNADYASSKAAIQYGLLRSLTKDVVGIHPRARVNAIAPGAVDTEQFRKECEEFGPGYKYGESQATVALKQPVPVEAVAKTCLFLASENWSGHITGQVVPIDSGKSGKLLWGRDEV